MIDRILFQIDGENLVLRYKDMLKAGRKPQKDVIFEQDSFLWHPKLSQLFITVPIRLSYYTTCVGDEQKLLSLSQLISSTKIKFYGPEYCGSGSLCPHVFKKEKTKQKTKSVDINITIDALRHTYNNSIDKIFLISGDGDYLPLIQEVMRQGKQVNLGAFSSGLNPQLPVAVDDFYDLDKIFFEDS